MTGDARDEAALGQTPWQTIGPFFHYALPSPGDADLSGASAIGARTDLIPAGHDGALHPPAARGRVAGRRIEIAGRVLDSEGAPVSDALLEIWQANAAGRYSSRDDQRSEPPLEPHFSGFGRAATGSGGEFRFLTVMPGRVPGPGNSLQAAHLAVGVFGRGLMKRLVTRIYFEDGEGLDEDPVLALTPVRRRGTLVARAEPATPDSYRFDIRLAGEHETVFFEF